MGRKQALHILKKPGIDIIKEVDDEKGSL